MLRFCGKGVYGAIAIGRLALHRRKEFSVRRSGGADPERELARLAAAKERALRELREIHARALTEVGETGAQIFEIHAMMLEDEDYLDQIKGTIEAQRVNAEYAVSRAGESFAEMLAGMEDAYMQARASDVKDVTARLLGAFGEGSESGAKQSGSYILCADDLAPSETVLLDKSRVLAFVTEEGTPSSHTAILARSMNIPAVIGVGAGFLASAVDGMTAIVDGYSGEVVLAPSERELASARERQKDDEEKKKLLGRLRGKENVTLDGRRIEIYANIGKESEIGAALAGDAGGIGLFRTEFSYLEKSALPSEEELFASYRRVLEGMGGRRVIIRTLDIGADKQSASLDLGKEENPALGLRGARVYFEHPSLFRTQLRALYRASAYGNLAIMLPMITSEWEVRELFSAAASVREELRLEKTEISEGVQHGIMIETPAAALTSDRLAPLVDFFSIGTNDLTQYTLACDRQNARLNRFCDLQHEAVLRLIRITAENAHKHGAWIGICGELASDTSLTRAFLEMGIDELSVSPNAVLPLRDVVRRLDLSKADG